MGGVRKGYKKVYGVGVNDADYVTRDVEITKDSEGNGKRKIVWSCPYYGRWSSMLGRCYSKRLHKDRPSYSDCAVVPEWLSFMSFRAWMMEQEWEGKHLDKDLLVPHNKLYSPETCIFITQKVNGFITGQDRQPNELPIGVGITKEGKFRATARERSGTKRTKRLLIVSDCPVECHSVWLADKVRRAKLLAAEQDDTKVAEALVDRYENFHKYFPQTVYGIPLEDYKGRG